MDLNLSACAICCDWKLHILFGVVRALVILLCIVCECLILNLFQWSVEFHICWEANDPIRFLIICYSFICWSRFDAIRVRRVLACHCSSCSTLLLTILLILILLSAKTTVSWKDTNLSGSFVDGAAWFPRIGTVGIDSARRLCWAFTDSVWVLLIYFVADRT